MADSRISDIGRRGVATDELRRHNLSAVLDRLHLVGPMSRSELADQTGLNRSTIRDLLSELAAAGLIVEERGTPSAGPGRPSSVATVAPAGAVVLAVELEVDSIAVATVGLGGHLFGETREPNVGIVSPEDVMRRLSALSRPLLADLPPVVAPVGVGVAVAGVVRRSDGYVHVAPNLGWRDVPVAEMVGSELGLDLVRVANEADMGALGEFRRGAGRNSRHMIYVTGEVGVGIGIIHEGSPMLGVAGYAGEAGHTLVNPNGLPCRCGSTGCWETEAGEEALIRRVGIDASSYPDPIAEIVRRAENSDAKTRSALWEVGRWLGIGIGNLVNVLNPDTVVVGGFYQRIYPFIASALGLGAESVALDAPWDACSVVPSQLGPNALVIGAAEQVLSEVVADPVAMSVRTQLSPG